ncbi:hypothetical protein, partial [Streptomyces sp. NPDC001999]
NTKKHQKLFFSKILGTPALWSARPTALPGPRRDTVRLPDNGLDKEAVDIRIMERQPCQFVRLKESL